MASDGFWLLLVASWPPETAPRPPLASSPRQVLAECEAYEQWNGWIAGKFVSAAWRLLAEAGEDMAVHGRCLAASPVKRLAVSFRGCAAFDDAMANLLAASLPPSLEELRLETTHSAATAAGGAVLLAGVLGRVRLEGLQLLYMHDCLLEGPIPNAFGECTALQMLDLAGNQLSGAIPDAVGRCHALVAILLQNNRLTGAVPQCLGALTSLVRLCLNGNRLTGTLPAALGGCTALEQLRVQSNLLQAPLPAALGQCPRLRELKCDAPLLADLPEVLHDQRQAGELHLNEAKVLHDPLAKGANRVAPGDARLSGREQVSEFALARPRRTLQERLLALAGSLRLSARRRSMRPSQQLASVDTSSSAGNESRHASEVSQQGVASSVARVTASDTAR